MKTKEVLELLSKAFEGFIFHPKFIEELYGLLIRDLKGKEKIFFKCLTTQLHYIKSLGVMVHTADGHEIIHGFDGHYYSIHIQQGQFNIRFLVHITNNGTPTFLCAFHERAGHKRTGYDEYTIILKQRFDELQGDEDNE